MTLKRFILAAILLIVVAGVVQAHYAGKEAASADVPAACRQGLVANLSPEVRRARIDAQLDAASDGRRVVCPSE